MNLFKYGALTLHSGAKSMWKIDCDALTDDDLKTLAFMLTAIVPEFGSVEGVPRGGLRLAAALQEYVTKGPVLIVDDVLTTGASMNVQRGDRHDAIGAVLFARGPVPLWVFPLFTHFHEI